MDEYIPRMDFKGALEQLEKFSKIVEKPSLNLCESSQVLYMTPASFKGIINLAYRVIDIFSNSSRPNDFIDQVRISGDIVKRYFPLIDLLEEGDPIQQKFARDIKEIVNRFNCAVDSYVLKFPSWGKRIARFLYKQGVMIVGGRLAKIELPIRASKQIHFSQFQAQTSLVDQGRPQRSFQDNRAPSSLKISALCCAAMPLIKPAAQTMELYLVKVSSLLEKSGLLLNSEAREIVRHSEYQFTLDKESEVMTISQVLLPIPGQSIEVSGAFKRDPRTLLFNILMPESCYLSTNSKQTGFPHPLQRHGWSLSEALIPICVPDSAKTIPYSSLHSAKKKIALDLLPGGCLNLKARLLLKMKKQAFENELSLFLHLHCKLASALCQASYNCSIGPSLEVIKRFFNFLLHHPKAYLFLSNVHHEILTGSAVLPYKALLKALAMGKIPPGFQASLPEKILVETYESAIRQMAERQSEKAVSDYIILMGNVLALPSRQIILQSFADVAHFNVPDLNTFALKIQSSLYLQLQDFHHELAVAPNQIDMALRMRRLLEDEISVYI